MKHSVVKVMSYGQVTKMGVGQSSPTGLSSGRRAKKKEKPSYQDWGGKVRLGLLQGQLDAILWSEGPEREERENNPHWVSAVCQGLLSYFSGNCYHPFCLRVGLFLS